MLPPHDWVATEALDYRHLEGGLFLTFAAAGLAHNRDQAKTS